VQHSSRGYLRTAEARRHSWGTATSSTVTNAAGLLDDAENSPYAASWHHRDDHPDGSVTAFTVQLGAFQPLGAQGRTRGGRAHRGDDLDEHRPDGQPPLHRHAQDRPQSEAHRVRDHANGIVEILEHERDREHPDQGLDEADCPGTPPAPPCEQADPDGADGDVGESKRDDQQAIEQEIHQGLSVRIMRVLATRVSCRQVQRRPVRAVGSAGMQRPERASPGPR
jgi:hypothetical protein